MAIQNSINIAITGEITGGSTPPPADWILATGFWDNTGIWDDTAVWID